MATTTTVHAQLIRYATNGDQIIVNLKSAGSDISIDRSTNTKLPSTVSSAQTLADALGNLAFKNSLGKGDVGLGNVDNTADSAKSVKYATTAGSAGSATKATQDSAGQTINSTYIKSLTVSGRTITITKGDNTTSTVTTQDTNTTYGVFAKATADAAGGTGLVPAPAKGQQGLYLRGDGSWATPTNTWRGVQDNLTSTATDQSLSANQGKVLKGLIDGKAASSHTHTASQITDNIPASKISGVLSLSNIPAGALERLIPVADDTARFKLTKDNAQNGDVIKVTNTGKMYFVKDDTKLTTEDGYEVFVAGTAAAVAWTNVTGRPSSMPASDVHPWAKAASKPSYSKSEVGLSNVDNTADSAKSVKYATSAGSAGSASSATKATQDSAGQQINSTYVKSLSVSGRTITITKGDNTTSTITTQDTNTDTKVTQTAIKSSDYTNWRTIPWGSSNSASEGFTPTTVTDVMYSDPNLTYQPSSGTLKAKVFKGSLSGNASSASSVAWANVSGRPSSMPASDVYAWAKAASKPSYSKGEVGLGNVDNTADSAKSVKYATSAGSASNVKDSNDSTDITFAYSKAGLDYGAYTWLAAWNGKELRAVNKNQFATASHSHNYAGSGSAGGAANSANKLATARTVSGGTDITLSFNYDGSGNSNANIGYYSSAANVGDSNHYPFHRFAKLDTITAAYSDKTTTFFISQDYNGGGFGIVRIVLRTNNSSSVSTVEVKWLVRCGLSADSVQVGIYNVFGKTYADAFFKTGGSYAGTYFRAIASGGRGNVSRTWVMVNSSEVSGTTASDAKTSTECYATIAAAGTALHKQAYSTIVSGSDGGTTSYANSAGSVAWGNVSGRPSSMPASDVPAWAKASSKPSYSKSEVGLGNVDNTADSAKSVKYATTAGSANAVTWANVSGKPSSFTPASHSHGAASASANGFMSSTDKAKLDFGDIVYVSKSTPTKACIWVKLD